MKIISLNGRSSCGKTHTLLMVCEMLSKYGRVIDEVLCGGDDKRVTYEVNDKVISVCTGGDNVEIIQENIEYFLNQNCDIAISACRSKSGPKWALESFADDNGYKLQKYVMPYAEFLGRETGMVKVEELVAEFLYKKVTKNGK